MTVEPISDEALAAIKAGLEGVTEGKWNKCGGATPAYTAIHSKNRGYIVFQMADASVDREPNNGALIKAPDMDEQRRNAAHIARMDPATVASMIARIEKAEARVKALEEALRPFASRAAQYDPAENDDEEPDWSEKEPGLTVGDIRRARAALEGK